MNIKIEKKKKHRMGGKGVVQINKQVSGPSEKGERSLGEKEGNQGGSRPFKKSLVGKKA